MAEKVKTTRILSIDALRGFDMFWITGGDAFFIVLFTLIGTPFFKKLAEQLDHPPGQDFIFMILFSHYSSSLSVSACRFPLQNVLSGVIHQSNFTFTLSAGLFYYICLD